MDEHEYVAGLREASGTFYGTYDSEVAAGLLAGVPELVPVEIDTYDKPNPAADAPPGAVLTATIGGKRWSFPVDHAEQLDGNRVRLWATRSGIREVTDG
jgi:hypothetical protein